MSATSTEPGPSRCAWISPLSGADAQSVFRAALDAFARPGTISRLPADRLADLPAALLPVLALADLSTPVCVLGDDRWAEVVRTTTSAPITNPARARLVSVPRQLAAGELAGFGAGSAESPEDGALVCLAVREITAGRDPGSGTARQTAVWRLTGPGVPGCREIRVAGVPDGFVRDRQRAVARFPAGVDVLLVTPDGLVTGLPRTTQVSEEDA